MGGTGGRAAEGFLLSAVGDDVSSIALMHTFDFSGISI